MNLFEVTGDGQFVWVITDDPEKALTKARKCLHSPLEIREMPKDEELSLWTIHG